MMIYVEAPTIVIPQSPSMFLAGGITGCPDWQSEIRGRLINSINVFNPRRQNFPIDDPDAAFEQIKWEHDALKLADSILFWFPKETLCPIVLYELGAWSMTDKPIFIGVHPEYRRLEDVIIQTQLVRPDVEVVDELDELIRNVNKWARLQRSESKKRNYK